MSAGYEGTPAAVLRQVLGEVPGDEDAARFRAEMPGREAAKRAFEEAWGFADARGRTAERGWRRIELREQHRRHSTGEEWHGPLDDADVAKIIRRMRVSTEAAAIAARAQATRPGELPPGYAEARARVDQATRGVAGAS